MGVGEKQKVDLDSMGPFVLKSTYVTKKIYINWKKKDTFCIYWTKNSENPEK